MTKISADRKRYNFGRIHISDAGANIPNLIEVQEKSYRDFLQLDVPQHERENKGLEAIFRSIFPISDHEQNATIAYVGYDFGKPKYDAREAIRRGVNYAVPLIVGMRLIVWENREDGTKEIRSIKEQDVYMGEIPLMTKSGTFIVNGAQRVVISQMHRSPGAFYTHDGGKNNASGLFLYSVVIIPYRGSWLGFEFDAKGLVHCKIDRKKKFLATTLLRALGYTNEDILNLFYKKHQYRFIDGRWVTSLDINSLRGAKLAYDVVDAKTGEVLIKGNVRITPRFVREHQHFDGVSVEVPESQITGSYIATSVCDASGDEIVSAGQEITEAILHHLTNVIGLQAIETLHVDSGKSGMHMRNTLMADKQQSRDEALCEVYGVLRPGEVATPEAGMAVLQSLFFDDGRYDLSAVGRMKLNVRHDLKIPEDVTHLTNEDIIAVLKHLLYLHDNNGDVDDVDNLGNRRVKSVGELIENQFRLGLVRIEKSIGEKMNAAEVDTVMPHDLINSKTLMAIIAEFFGTSQLSQFMDQTNPLSEVTHKRRVSALGPGGLTRERAGFAVRDVHYTHYGRICPIETPEGQNIGLINSLSTYARINKYGFIETPYRMVVDSKVTNEVFHLSAMEEAKYSIAQANVDLNPDGSFVDETVSGRRGGEWGFFNKQEIEYMDISPKQLVSVAASLIPFLENDDANRALMGANMQRQAVPLLRAEAPLVGTGMEGVVARDSGSVVVAQRSGVVDWVDASRIVVKQQDDDTALGIDVYTLEKYNKSNQGTCINHKPIVKKGEWVNAGEVIADNTSTEKGELALGHNVLVAFMPWNGYNFEDSILVSERIVQEDKFTSVHIEEFEVVARDTRLGHEEITADIPNVGQEQTRNLDENGIIRVGSPVKAGDILVGKVTPKVESPLTPEEKLLRAIFGEKASDVKDTSLRVPTGMHGVVIDVVEYTRRGVEKNESTQAWERMEIEKFIRDRNDYATLTYQAVNEKWRKICADAGIEYVEVFAADGKVDLSVIEEGAASVLLEKASQLGEMYADEIKKIDFTLSQKMERLQSGDDLPHGALKMIKVYVATRLKLQPGDKMAGRHGNKGVVSRVMPIEDMPFLEDGTPVDIVLNPLGVPSRMNLGQVLETHLGWASANLGAQVRELLDKVATKQSVVADMRAKLIEIYDRDQVLRTAIAGMSEDEVVEFADGLRRGVPVSTPVFDGAKIGDIEKMLEKAGVDVSGQVTLIDGCTGETFDRKVTVGYLYMLKLDHLVDNKVHARSTGPYSLVTQQPLGGKQYFGGQRFGEMEVWALQAYGAAHTLHEMLTVKSDDVVGRNKMYESIVRNEQNSTTGVPESFNVILMELRSLCLDVEMLNKEERP